MTSSHIGQENAKKKVETAPSSWGFWLVAFVCLLFVYQLFFAPKGETLSGKPAPLFLLKSVVQTKEWKPSWKNKVTVLEFWATWCPSCLRKLASSTRLAVKNQKRGIQHLLVNVDQPFSVEKLRSFLASRKIPKASWKVHHRDVSGRGAQRFQVHVLPSTVVIGRDGKIVQFFQGGVARSVLQAYIKQAK